MPRRSPISLLPDAVLAALNHRIVDSAFGDYELHSEWLKGQGFNIGKSALHRYGQEHRDELLSEVEGRSDKSVDLRMRCLECASRTSGPIDPFILCQRAEVLLGWLRAA